MIDFCISAWSNVIKLLLQIPVLQEELFLAAVAIHFSGSLQNSVYNYSIASYSGNPIYKMSTA